MSRLWLTPLLVVWWDCLLSPADASREPRSAQTITIDDDNDDDNNDNDDNDVHNQTHRNLICNLGIGVDFLRVSSTRSTFGHNKHRPGASCC